ncbi:hypothetical protein CRG98_035393 [Punica granatum]|uniref:Uncharacterized protein n=1 Tax=Punica granatum TaxID=22663 RepID=A0A2I0IKH9_PUNGR|nr:hypothetical protein CRG98_035393 [Punica granatum]
METKSQNSVANSVSSGSAGNSSEPPDSVPLDSTAEAGQANGGDWQEEIYQKFIEITVMLRSSPKCLQMIVERFSN